MPEEKPRVEPIAFVASVFETELQLTGTYCGIWHALPSTISHANKGPLTQDCLIINEIQAAAYKERDVPPYFTFMLSIRTIAASALSLSIQSG